MHSLLEFKLRFSRGGIKDFETIFTIDFALSIASMATFWFLFLLGTSKSILKKVQHRQKRRRSSVG